ncbi:MAG: O-antigen ligase family protein, partial [Thermodesulfobacteriota bacterium]|nr:O-antigen ligase family protein [Thermodesulfobacteriota bacterium]
MIKKHSGQIETKAIFPLLAIIMLTGLGGLLLSKASLNISFLIIAIFVFAVISFLSSEIALYLLIISMLLSPEFMVGGLVGGGATAGRGVTIRFDDFLMVVIGLGWFLKTAIQKELGIFLKTPLNKPIAYYIIVCLIATLFGFMTGRVKLLTGLFFVLKYFEYFIVYFMAVNYLKEKKQMERFIALMLAVCFVICVVAIIQIPAGGRVTAPFEGAAGEPNTLGGYLVLMLSLALGLLLTEDSTKHKKLLVLLIFMIGTSLLATLSRSSWLAVAPMLIALIYYGKKKMVLIVPLIIVVLISPFVLPHAVKERALYTVTQREHAGQIEVGGVRIDTSTSARINSWKNVLTKDFIKHPVIGYGVTGYSFVDAQYPRVLVETGIIGLTAFLFLLYSIYKNALYTYRN